MVQILIWLGVLFCPNPFHTVTNHGNCKLQHAGGPTTQDTGGETGTLTPKPPVPPPPPPPPPGN